MALGLLGIPPLPIPAPPNSSENPLPFTSRRAILFSPTALMASLLAFPLPTHAALPHLQDPLLQEEDRIVSLFQVPPLVLLQSFYFNSNWVFPLSVFFCSSRLQFRKLRLPSFTLRTLNQLKTLKTVLKNLCLSRMIMSRLKGLVPVLFGINLAIS